MDFYIYRVDDSTTIHINVEGKVEIHGPTPNIQHLKNAYDNWCFLKKELGL